MPAARLDLSRDRAFLTLCIGMTLALFAQTGLVYVVAGDGDLAEYRASVGGRARVRSERGMEREVNDEVDRNVWSYKPRADGITLVRAGTCSILTR